MEYFGVVQVFLQEANNRYSSKCVRISSITDCYELKSILKEKFQIDRNMRPNLLHLYEVHLNKRKCRN